MLNWERERAYGRQGLGSVVSGGKNHRQNPLFFRPLPLRIDIQGQWPQEEYVRIHMVFSVSLSVSACRVCYLRQGNWTEAEVKWGGGSDYLSRLRKRGSSFNHAAIVQVFRIRPCMLI